MRFSSLVLFLLLIGQAQLQNLGGNGILVLNNRRDSWHNAFFNCLNIGGALYAPGSLAEAEKIQDNLWSTDIVQIWIGIHDMFKDGRFVKPNGNNKITFINWLHGEPRKQNDYENCVIFDIHGRSQARDCDGNYAYYCIV